MKLTAALEIDTWIGPISKQQLIERSYLKNNTLIWYCELCSGGLNKPSSCAHEPITLKTYLNLPYTNTHQVFYSEQKSKSFLPIWLTGTFVLSSLGGITVFSAGGITIFDKPSKPNEETSVGEQAPSEKRYPNDTDEGIAEVKRNKIIIRGQEYTFATIILTSEYRWAFDDSEKTETQSIQNMMLEYFPRLPDLNQSETIISVGIASMEGGPKSEVTLADKRADTLIRELRVSSSEKNFFKLNLGQYSFGKKDISAPIDKYCRDKLPSYHEGKRDQDQKEIPSELLGRPLPISSDQRRVILIGVIHQGSPMDKPTMKEALYRELKRTLEIHHHYSCFDLQNSR